MLQSAPGCKPGFGTILCRSLPNDDVKFFIFKGLMKTIAYSGKSFILCLYMKTICAKRAKGNFDYFAQRDQHGTVAKHLADCKVLF